MKPAYSHLKSNAEFRPADLILRESEAFFMKEGKVYQTLKRLARALAEESIPYAIVGGMALNLLGYTRETVDVDILLTPEGLARFRERLVGRGYTTAFSGATKSFRDAQTQVKVEALVTGEYPGDGKPKPVAFPDPAEASFERDGYRVITLEKLIELKLASGMTAPHRLRDLADVQDLISVLALPLHLAEQLDESVRGEYRRLWQAVHRAHENP
ncbi:MAG: nucleotidyltransferase family protein [candidate division KSB1 bacterium]|nr:nucleotidyltransferase family protein [candidate division KSB1 bacterium]